MYFNQQKVYDKTNKKIVTVGESKDGTQFAWSNLPKNTTHLIFSETNRIFTGCRMSEKEATELLEKGAIKIPEI